MEVSSGHAEVASVNCHFQNKLLVVEKLRLIFSICNRFQIQPILNVPISDLLLQQSQIFEVFSHIRREDQPQHSLSIYLHFLRFQVLQKIIVWIL